MILSGVQMMVKTLFRQELTVCSNLDNPSVIHRDYPVCMHTCTAFLRIFRPLLGNLKHSAFCRRWIRMKTYQKTPNPELHIKELPSAERPREKLREKGSLALADTELLAIMIG